MYWKRLNVPPLAAFVGVAPPDGVSEVHVSVVGFVSISSPSFPDPFQGGSVAVDETQASRWRLDPAYRSPYTLSPQVSLTQHVPGNVRLTLSYNASYGRRQRRTPPEGTDRGRGVWHAKPIEEEGAGETQVSKQDPLPVKQREVTSVLVKTVNALVTPGLQNAINEGQAAQAVLPVRETSWP